MSYCIIAEYDMDGIHYADVDACQRYFPTSDSFDSMRFNSVQNEQIGNISHHSNLSWNSVNF